ncbi:MAG TPA: hypothetical protein VM305_04805 [Candidatus Limnocylindrales bacterium]|nr:hypothetical protein [Candidatus Limnocylindrales bacterium]
MTQTVTADGQPRPDDLRAEHVELSRGGANSIQATTVSITKGGAARVSANELSVSQGGVGLARARRIHLRGGSSVGAAAADEMTFEGGSNAMLIIARSVGGDVRPLLDWRAAAALGGAFGIALAVLRRR